MREDPASGCTDVTIILEPSKTYPLIRVTAHGGPLQRGDTIRHCDGSLWRYESLVRGNMAVAVTAPSRPGEVRHFAKSDFGIEVEKLAASA